MTAILHFTAAKGRLLLSVPGIGEVVGQRLKRAGSCAGALVVVARAGSHPACRIRCRAIKRAISQLAR
jgi:hypothetical protein